uniref:BTB domain-containing protein n=1 Tax=Varanus komodoensis TaxID=61221 RepID=A0A8D2KVG0_VARKO
MNLIGVRKSRLYGRWNCSIPVHRCSNVKMQSPSPGVGGAFFKHLDKMCWYVAMYVPLFNSLSSVVMLFLFFCRLLKEEIQTDVTFCVGNILFRAHKAVLLARVPDFFLQVSGRWLNNLSSSQVIHLENLEPFEFKTFLQAVYSSDRNMKEAEQEVLKKEVSKARLTKEDESLQVKHIQTVIFLSPVTNKTETASDLGRDLLLLYEKSWFSDINIWIDGKPFEVHRAILCARSSYFAAMLNGSWAESSQDHITLQG